MWGVLAAHEGSVEFQFEGADPLRLSAGDRQAIAPGRTHHVILVMRPASSCNCGVHQLTPNLTAGAPNQDAAGRSRCGGLTGGPLYA
jgi:hypothetical protein